MHVMHMERDAGHSRVDVARLDASSAGREIVRTVAATRAGLGGELWTVSHLNVVERKSVDEERTATLPLHGVTWRKNVMEIWCDMEKESMEV